MIKNCKHWFLKLSLIVCGKFKISQIWHYLIQGIGFLRIACQYEYCHYRNYVNKSMQFLDHHEAYSIIPLFDPCAQYEHNYSHSRPFPLSNSLFFFLN